MTVDNTGIANGPTQGTGAVTDYTYNKRFDNDADLVVIHRLSVSPFTQTVKTLGVDYTIIPNGEGPPYLTGCTIRHTIPVPANIQVLRYRHSAIQQAVDFAAQNNLPTAAIELGIDTNTMSLQEMQDEVSRAVVRDRFTSTNFSMTLPAEISESGSEFKCIIVNANRNGFAVSTISPEDTANSAAAALVSELAAAASAAAALASEAAAAASELAAATSAASINLPLNLSGQALKILQVKADTTGYQFLTLGAIATLNTISDTSIETNFWTGLMGWSYSTVVPNGWIIAQGTIGNASSGASRRANADCAALFAYLWAGMDNAQAAVSTGRGASAALDFAAGKTITFPVANGKNFRAVDDLGGSQANVITTVATGGTNRNIVGALAGEEATGLTANNNGTHSHTYNRAARNNTAGNGSTAYETPSETSASTTTSGLGTAHNNVDPCVFAVPIIKL